MHLEETEDFLKKEKEMVGIYLSAHPLDRFSFEMKHFTSHSLKQIREILEDAQKEVNFTAREFLTGGIVSGVTSALSKNSGRPWGTFTLEDYTSSWKFTLFGKEYEQFLPYMRQGEALLVRYSLQERIQYKRKDRNEKCRDQKKKKSDSKHIIAGQCKRIFKCHLHSAERGRYHRVLPKRTGQGAVGQSGKITVHFVLKDKTNKMAVKLFSRSPDRPYHGFSKWLDKRPRVFR